MSKTAATSHFVIHTIYPRRTWSLAHQASGMEIAVVTGKRRRDALVSSLPVTGTWRDLCAAALAWKQANPR